MWRQRFRIQMENYCDDSTLHGVRYISEKNRPIIEKFLWLLAIIWSATMAVLIIYSSWQKFQTDPTITGVDVNFHNKTLLFPATFICPHDPIDYTKFDYILAAELELVTNSSNYNELFTFFQNLPSLNFDRLENLPIPIGFEYRNKKSLNNLILGYVHSCPDFFVACTIKSKSFNCCEQFRPVLTEKGFCYVFNNHRDSTNLTYIFESDISWNLEILTRYIKIPSAVYFTDSHAWLETSATPQFIWTHGYTSTLLLDIQEFYNDENIRELSLKQRKCIFSNQLEYMPTGVGNYGSRYEYTECLIECRKLMQYKLCKCILYFYGMEVQKTGHKNFKECSPRQLLCIKLNLAKIRAAQCECRENCHTSEYKVYKTVNVPKIKKITKISELTVYEEEVDPDFHDVPLTIGFYSWPLVRYKREILFGWIDLLVSFGGIAGLFLGFSLLSAIEFVYYFTVRFYFANRWRNKRVAQRKADSSRMFVVATQKVGQHPYEFVL